MERTCGYTQRFTIYEGVKGMMELLYFLLGYLVAQIVTRYKVNKLLMQLHKVSKTGEEDFRCGVKYAIMQIIKML